MAMFENFLEHLEGKFPQFFDQTLKIPDAKRHCLAPEINRELMEIETKLRKIGLQEKMITIVTFPFHDYLNREKRVSYQRVAYLKLFKKEFQFIKELETASPRCMVFDHEDLLWVGTRSHGLMGFQYKNNQLKKIYHFQTHDGLTDNYVTALACDKNNNIIIGTQTGLDRLVKTKNSYRIENLTKSNNIFSFITRVSERLPNIWYQS